jgi:predicted transcriptional regulator
MCYMNDAISIQDWLGRAERLRVSDKELASLAGVSRMTLSRCRAGQGVYSGTLSAVSQAVVAIELDLLAHLRRLHNDEGLAQ